MKLLASNSKKFPSLSPFQYPATILGAPSLNIEIVSISFNWLFFFRFKAKAMQISSLLKDRRRTPLEETCDWIEYVLRHGGARHLRPQVFNIPWYQYYLLDVMAFLVAIVALVGMVIWMTCRCLCRFCRKSGSKPKKD